MSRLRPGWVIAIPLLVAGCFGPDTTPVPQPADAVSEVEIGTSDWHSGDDAILAMAGGTLSFDSKGCAFLSGQSAAPVALVWPAGFSAWRYEDGKVRVLTPDGSVAAEEGAVLDVGGGYSDIDDKHCARGAGDAFFINEEMDDQ